jgi:hypothetical protein
MHIKLGFIIVVFLLGLYFTVCDKHVEGLTGTNTRGCPDVLIQKGTKFYLYNSKRATIPGVNPISFNKLSDYIEFTEWQRSQNITCPILYLQEAYDVQGETVYKARVSPTKLQGGVPDQHVEKLTDAGRDDDPFNQNSFPGIEVQDQYIGVTTPLDQMYNETGSSVSPNPMDTHWGGKEFTETLVEKGYYDDRLVTKPATS